MIKVHPVPPREPIDLSDLLCNSLCVASDPIFYSEKNTTIVKNEMQSEYFSSDFIISGFFLSFGGYHRVRQISMVVQCFWFRITSGTKYGVNFIYTYSLLPPKRTSQESTEEKFVEGIFYARLSAFK